ncbi:MAG TPA: alkaline phosphatase family protein [Acidimicrobiales bacterium]|nr:alkaline phosphatase family protein [Acidimicrobiales bacterium]
MSGEISRRELLGGAAALAAVAVGAGCNNFGGGGGTGSTTTIAESTKCGSLADIEHIVILVQENRSFDHYFGSYKGVKGFSDPAALIQSNGNSVFAQDYPANTGQYGSPVGALFPYHLNTANSDAECINDITHSWGPQHLSWNGGTMDQFVAQHVAVDGAAIGPLTMGYYNRQDIPFHYALADAFTICDNYHCSVLGPSDPNHLYAISAWIDPAGTQGGPVTETYTWNHFFKFGSLGWTSMPERLQSAGVPWKYYASPTGSVDNPLVFFKSCFTNTDLVNNGLLQSYPSNFQEDVASGNLPNVSWIAAPLEYSEHPSTAPDWGAYVINQILSTLTSNPSVWARTAFFVTYDENGGFFDHVPPPTAPAGTAGEYLTASTLPSTANGISGPIGLGFRVPMLVISPFSRGGLVCSDVFDHTSLLRLIETRFGVEVPNLSAWRRSITGDLTSAFNFASPPDNVFPSLPTTSLTSSNVLNECLPGGITGLLDLEPAYPIPENAKPAQESGSPVRPSGIVSCPAPT